MDRKFFEDDKYNTKFRYIFYRQVDDINFETVFGRPKISDKLLI